MPGRLFRRCVQCPTTTPSCPSCSADQTCQITEQSCDACASAACVATDGNGTSSSLTTPVATSASTSTSTSTLQDSSVEPTTSSAPEPVTSQVSVSSSPTSISTSQETLPTSQETQSTSQTSQAITGLTSSSTSPTPSFQPSATSFAAVGLESNTALQPATSSIPSSTSFYPSATVQSTSTAQTPSSSGLPTGAKAGITVAIVLLCLSALALGTFFFLKERRRKTTTARLPSFTVTGHDDEKLELFRVPNNAAIAGPVRSRTKPAASASHSAQMRKLSSIPELPSRLRHELPNNAISEADGQCKAPSMPFSNPAIRVFKYPPPQTRPQPRPRPHPNQHLLADLNDEVDSLLAELGVITKRKRRLLTSAIFLDLRTEEVGSRKGVEFMNLGQREAAIRQRLGEIEEERRVLENVI